MIEFNLKKYIDYVKNTIEYPIEDYYIEKDYVISFFLSTWQNLREQGKLASLEKLIFKGGTLLMRNYLFYPRISEDLDFTHQHCEHIRKMSQNKRIQTIRNLIIPLLKDIKTICGYQIPNSQPTNNTHNNGHKHLTFEESQLLKTIGEDPIHIDDIIAAVHIPTPTVIATLAQLELKGIIKQIEGKKYITTVTLTLGDH